MRRAVILMIGLSLLGGGAHLLVDGTLLRRASSPFAFRPAQALQSAGLRTVAADRGTISLAITATGTVNPVVSVQVGSQLSGQIRELLADFNTVVRAGQPVARLDTATIEARRAAALADIEAAEAEIAVAQAQAERAGADEAQARAQQAAAEAAVLSADANLRDLEGEARRAAELRARGVGAERDALRTGFAVERARAELAQARANAAQAEAGRLAAGASARTALARRDAALAGRSQRQAQLRQVDVDLANATIRSPIDGVVVSRNVDLGQTVAASFQAPVLFQIAASLAEMEVWATVDEADIGRVRPGQEVTFTVAAHPQRTMQGRVKDIRLAAATVQNVVTYTVVVTAPNGGGLLLPGMTATLRILAETREAALRVPNAALRWRPRESGVVVPVAPSADAPGRPETLWVLEHEASPRPVPVRTGLSDGTFTEILGGALPPGARVVVGQDRAARGAPAAARRLF